MAWLTAVGSLVVLTALVVFAWPRLQEEWWIHCLRRGEELERIRAAEKLVEVKSKMAVPELVAAIARSPIGAGRDSESLQDWRSPLFIDFHRRKRSNMPSTALLERGGLFLYYMLVTIGEPAVPLLIKCVVDEGNASLKGFIGSMALRDIQGYRKNFKGELPAPEWGLLASVNLFALLAADESLSPAVRTIAAEALKEAKSRPLPDPKAAEPYRPQRPWPPRAPVDGAPILPPTPGSE